MTRRNSDPPRHNGLSYLVLLIFSMSQTITLLEQAFVSVHAATPQNDDARANILLNRFLELQRAARAAESKGLREALDRYADALKKIAEQ